ncbi:phospholipase A2 family protein [Microvirga guangxiensis]|uniref:Phospholipase A2 n=1 Tax=Microvirga guangxiensis TaxID=549386 RepID=A0A1G5LFL3_9HYPH|nr:phospholipase A2 family protein [Microvirga guangxiensis]SCZ11632.1 Phospholipase A2 [Microvirga guangxiensis]
MLIACMAVLAPGPASATPSVAKVPQSAPPLFHGNWCGAGDANRASPVDALDAACRAHDLCYERVGRRACTCDRALLKATAALIRNPATQESVRSKAATVNSLFSAALCQEDEKTTQGARKR